MKKGILLTVLVAMIALLCVFVGCATPAAAPAAAPAPAEAAAADSASDAAAAPEAAAEYTPTKVILASEFNPNSVDTGALTYLAKILTEKSGGAIECEVYDSAVLGSAEEIVEQAMNGSVNICFVNSSTIQKYAPKFNTFEIPYLYPDNETLRGSLNGKIGQAAEEVFEGYGLAWSGDYAIFRGNRQLTANKEVRAAADMKGIKLRIPETEVWMKYWQATGAQPTVVTSSEVFSSLQLGVIDAQENPISSNYDKGLWEVQKYTVMTNHIVEFSMLSYNVAWFNSLNQATQELVVECLKEASQYACDQFVQAEGERRAEMEAKGMVFIDDPDKKSFQDIAITLLEDVKTDWDDWVYEELLNDLK